MGLDRSLFSPYILKMEGIPHQTERKAVIVRPSVDTNVHHERMSPGDLTRTPGIGKLNKAVRRVYIMGLDPQITHEGPEMMERRNDVHKVTDSEGNQGLSATRG